MTRKTISTVQSWLQTIVGSALLLAVGYLGYRLVRADLAANVYRERLEVVAKDYSALRQTYNEAIARTAVTELVVENNALSVRVRTADGLTKDIPTGIDPSREVYVDFIVIDGRLWVRRVFDQKTPPEKGVQIDPSLAGVDWKDPRVAHGKAVYRTLGEGRWVVSVSGDGSLGLNKADGPTSLVRAPEIKNYDKAAEEAKASGESIGASEVWKYLVGG